MPISLQHERDNVYRLDLAGALHQGEFRQAQDALEREIARVGPVRLLFVLRQFEGWERSGDWEDMSFYVRHGHHVDRIAIAGPEQWREDALMFAGAALRQAPVEYFGEDALDEARAWLVAAPTA